MMIALMAICAQYQSSRWFSDLLSSEADATE